jgi:hypothetical protein
MSLLDGLIYGVRGVFVAGREQPDRPAINFATGVKAVDNPSAKRLDLTVTGEGLEFVTKFSGDTLEADKLNELSDNESPTPSFVLEAPANWPGRKLVAKRLNQGAPEVTLTAAGGALIDGAASYTLRGNDVCAEFYSDGARILVGPTTGAVGDDDEPIDELPGCDLHVAPWDPSLFTLVSGAVQAAADRGGGSNVATAVDVASRPLYNTTGANTQNGQPSISFTFNQGSFSGGFYSPTGATSGAAPYSLACCAKFTAIDGASQQTLMNAGSYVVGSTSWGAWIAATAAGAELEGGGYGRGQTTTQDADLLPHVFVSTYDGTTVRFYVDGFLVSQGTPPTPTVPDPSPAANSVNMQTGRIGYYRNAAGSSLAACAHFDTQWAGLATSEARVRKYSRQCAKKFGLWKVGLIYGNGDSLVQGNTLVDGTKAWMAQIAALLPFAVQVINAGLGNRTIEQIAVTAPGIRTATSDNFSGQRQFRPKSIGNIEFVWAGTNDNFANSQTSAAIIAWLTTTRAASLAKGFCPIFGTMLRRAGGTGGQETVRQEVNTFLRASGWRLLDLADHPAFLSTASVAQSVVGFHDGIHPSEAANVQVIAPAAAACVLSAINSEPVT